MRDEPPVNKPVDFKAREKKTPYKTIAKKFPRPNKDIPIWESDSGSEFGW